jgi:NGP1NT (NUC091) domain
MILKTQTVKRFVLSGLSPIKTRMYRQRPHIVETEPFADTFGPKAQRKRPRIEVDSFEELGKIAGEQDSEPNDDGTRFGYCSQSTHPEISRQL